MIYPNTLQDENPKMPCLASHAMCLWGMDKEKGRRQKGWSCRILVYKCLLKASWTERRTNDSKEQQLQTTRKLLNTINDRRLKHIDHVSRNIKTYLMKTVFQGKIRSPTRKNRPWVSYPISVLLANPLILDCRTSPKTVRTETDGEVLQSPNMIQQTSSMMKPTDDRWLTPNTDSNECNKINCGEWLSV